VEFLPSVEIVHRVCIWNISKQSIHYPVMQGTRLEACSDMSSNYRS